MADVFELAPFWYISVITWFVPTVLFIVAQLQFGKTVSCDMLEHSSVGSLKEFARNTWVNLAVVLALILSLLLGMAQVDCIDGDCYSELSLAYILWSCSAVLLCLAGLALCVISLTYVEPLDEVGVIQYLIANPAQIGLAAVYCLLSAIYLLVALLIWVVAAYGIVALAGVTLVAIVQIVIVAINIQDKSAFDPAAAVGSKRWREWAWPGLSRVEEWPSFARKMAPKGMTVVDELPERHKVRIFLRLHTEMLAMQAAAREKLEDE